MVAFFPEMPKHIKKDNENPHAAEQTAVTAESAAAGWAAFPTNLSPSKECVAHLETTKNW